MEKAKDQGLIKHICCSFHAGNDDLMKIVDTGFYESITLQYNMLDRQLEEGIARAHEKGMGVVVMGPVGGGRLGVDSEVLGQLVPGVQRIPELAMRFVLSNPNVSIALSGMSTMQQVEENIATANDPNSLSDEELQAIGEHLIRLQKMAELYCSGCGYCKPCPNEVNIPHIFGLYNTARVYGLWQPAVEGYNQIGKNPWIPGKTGDACVECGQCEEKCPQHLQISKQLAEAHSAFTDWQEQHK
jgi:predicted aldo/keto reductase-like oxidoreductase